jgi:hypothetical protein
LARREHAARLALKPHQHMRIVVEPAARHEGRQIG